MYLTPRYSANAAVFDYGVTLSVQVCVSDPDLEKAVYSEVMFTIDRMANTMMPQLELSTSEVCTGTVVIFFLSLFPKLKSCSISKHYCISGLRYQGIHWYIGL